MNDNFSSTHRPKRQARIDTRCLPNQLARNHNIKALTEIVLMEDHIARDELYALRRGI